MFSGRTGSLRGARRVGVIGSFIAVAVFTAAGAFAVPSTRSDVENGRKLYLKYCYQCHGLKGKGDGPAAIYQAARPRDFTDGVFKLKTSPPKYLRARDEDIFIAITNGMPGSGMPRWENILTEQERWDLVAYIKSLSDMFEEEPNPPALDYSGKIPRTEDSVERGRWVYEELKCHECHGPAGQGPAIKVLKDDYGYRIWPRDLTKPWTYIGPFTAEDLYARVTNGIPLTPMPSFAKPGPEDAIFERKRWDVVNFVMHLADEAAAKRRRWRIEMGILTAIAVMAFYVYAKPIIVKYYGSKSRPGKTGGDGK